MWLGRGWEGKGLGGYEHGGGGRSAGVEIKESKATVRDRTEDKPGAKAGRLGINQHGRGATVTEIGPFSH